MSNTHTPSSYKGPQSKQFKNITFKIYTLISKNQQIKPTFCVSTLYYSTVNQHNFSNAGEEWNSERTESRSHFTSWQAYLLSVWWNSCYFVSIKEKRQVLKSKPHTHSLSPCIKKAGISSRHFVPKLAISFLSTSQRNSSKAPQHWLRLLSSSSSPPSCATGVLKPQRWWWTTHRTFLTLSHHWLEILDNSMGTSRPGGQTSYSCQRGNAIMPSKAG